MHFLDTLFLLVEPSLLNTLDVRVHHLRNQLLKGGLVRVPAELGGRLLGVSNQELNLSRAVVLGIHTNTDLSGLLVLANLALFLALPNNGDSNDLERLLHKLAHRVLLAGGQDEVIGGGVLQNPPHALQTIIGSISSPFR